MRQSFLDLKICLDFKSPNIESFTSWNKKTKYEIKHGRRIERSLLRTVCSLLRIERSLLRIERSLLRIERSLLRIERSQLRIERSLLRTERSLLRIELYAENNSMRWCG